LIADLGTKLLPTSHFCCAYHEFAFSSGQRLVWAHAAIVHNWAKTKTRSSNMCRLSFKVLILSLAKLNDLTTVPFRRPAFGYRRETSH
jgi:hypothetical protein